jgi:kynureninase
VIVATLRDVQALDAQDPLGRFREHFVIADPDQCYLDGNSLGRLPRATVDAVHRVLQQEWGTELVTGWSHWVDMSQRVGDLVGSVALGAKSGQVLVTDTTSVNFYRLVHAALRDRPGRRTIVIDEANFPTDRYIAQGIAADLGLTLVTIPNEDPAVAEYERLRPEVLQRYLTDDVALVTLQVVNYRSGARQDVPALTQLVRDAGAHLLWDASHAIGALDLQFDAWGVDLAVGCTYKYCNAGPGAPAWLYIARTLQDRLSTPIDGWFAQRDQFDMGPKFDRATGMRGFQIASPSIIGLTCVETSLDLIGEAGMAAIEAKCAVGTELMVDLFDAWLAPLGFELETPRNSAHRGGHLSLTHPDAARIAHGMRVLANVIPDFRKPRTIRVAVSPLYNSFTELYEGFARLRDLVASNAHSEIVLTEGGVT